MNATSIKMVTVGTGNTRKIGYDEATQQLHVEYAGGFVYIYHGVPAEKYVEALAVAAEGESVGSWLAKNVKNVYRCDPSEKYAAA